MIALRLAKSGYWGGDPERVLSARVDLVIDAMYYERMTAEYEAAEYELNKEG